MVRVRVRGSRARVSRVRASRVRVRVSRVRVRGNRARYTLSTMTKRTGPASWWGLGSELVLGLG